MTFVPRFFIIILMDRVLDSFSNKSTPQKTIIVILVTFLFLGVLAVLYFITTPAVTNQTQNQNSQSPQVTPSSQNPQLPSNKWQSYSAPYFIINYPQDFSYQAGVISGGGTSLILKPQTQNSTNEVIEIQTYSPSVASQSAVENGLTALGYQRSDITVSSIPATEFTGSISGGGSTLREIAVVFTYQNRVYKFQLSYSSQQKNSGIEQIFNTVVSSFKPQTGY